MIIPGEIWTFFFCVPRLARLFSFTLGLLSKAESSLFLLMDTVHVHWISAVFRFFFAFGLLSCLETERSPEESSSSSSNFEKSDQFRLRTCFAVFLFLCRDVRSLRIQSAIHHKVGSFNWVCSPRKAQQQVRTEQQLTWSRLGGTWYWKCTW